MTDLITAIAGTPTQSSVVGRALTVRARKRQTSLDRSICAFVRMMIRIPTGSHFMRLIGAGSRCGSEDSTGETLGLWGVERARRVRRGRRGPRHCSRSVATARLSLRALGFHGLGWTLLAAIAEDSQPSESGRFRREADSILSAVETKDGFGEEGLPMTTHVGPSLIVTGSSTESAAYVAAGCAPELAHDAADHPGGMLRPVGKQGLGRTAPGATGVRSAPGATAGLQLPGRHGADAMRMKRDAARVAWFWEQR